MQRITENQTGNIFVRGQIAQEVGDYFVLIRRYNEAKEEYQDALTAYNLISHASPAFAEAQNKKRIVQKILDNLRAKPEKPRAEFMLNSVKHLINWLSPLWQPPLAGQFVTAADISEKHHSFKTDNGDISISCQWKGESDDEPAYIFVKWKANISTDRTLLIRFVNPDTQEIRSEFHMGNIFVGEESFTKDELGFDPFRENWSVAVALVTPCD